MEINPENIHRRLGSYLIVWLIFWIGWGITLLIFGYEDSFLFAHGIRNWVSDLIMPHLTHIGDGLFITGIVALSLARRHLPVLLTLVVGMLLVMIASGVAKNLLFEDWYRPTVHFAEQAGYFDISLVTLRNHSFPSGHAMAVGAALTYPVWEWGRGRPWVGIALGLLGVTVAWSRVYIGVHFLGDILVGSIIGVGLAVFSLKVIWPYFDGYWRRISPSARRSWTVMMAALAVIATGLAIFTLYVRMYQ